MSKPRPSAVSLGDIPPTRSRHQGRRSAIELTENRLVVGTADGKLRAFDRGTLSERWAADAVDGSIVALEATAHGLVVGERGLAGAVCLYEPDGTCRWRYESRTDVGAATKETRFFLPFVVSVASTDHSVYVAARRYERDGDDRQFESVVSAFAPDGMRRWTYATDASPISLAADGKRVAVAYNRCPGKHQRGLVVLDAETGTERWDWDPGTDGHRRVGDVSLVAGRVAVTSHGDYCGYLLDDGDERWTVNLATPTTVDGELVYAYPNHVHATESGCVFVTGNTYPAEGRETDARHPEEHTAVGVGPDGSQRFSLPVSGFASGLGTAGERLAVPAAQNFRERNPDDHACLLVDVADGRIASHGTDGVVTAAAVDGETVVAIEEPVVYHDDGTERGAYRVHQFTAE